MSTFLPEDLQVLEKTQRMRERLAEKIMSVKDEDLPRKPSDLMAITNLLESIDRSVLGRVKLRIDDDSNKNNEANKAILRDILMQLHQNKSAPAIDVEAKEAQPTQAIEPPAYTPSSRPVQPGELILKTDIPEMPEDFL